MSLPSPDDESNLPDDGLEAMDLPPADEWTDEDELHAYDEWALRRLRAQLAQLEQVRAALTGDEPDVDIIEQGRRAEAELPHVEAAYAAGWNAYDERMARRLTRPRIVRRSARAARTVGRPARRAAGAASAGADPPPGDDDEPGPSGGPKGRDAVLEKERAPAPTCVQTMERDDPLEDQRGPACCPTCGSTAHWHRRRPGPMHVDCVASLGGSLVLRLGRSAR